MPFCIAHGVEYQRTLNCPHCRPDQLIMIWEKSLPITADNLGTKPAPRLSVVIGGVPPAKLSGPG